MKLEQKQISDPSEIKVYINDGNFPLLSEIASESNKLILDVGCGAGQNGRYLSSIGNVVDGITLSEEEANIARNSYRNVWVYNIENGLPADINYQYDIVILSHVLEHIAYPEKLFTSIHSLIHSDCEVHIALPNLMNYGSRFKLMMGNFDYQHSGIWDYTHLRWYTFATSKKLLENHGFTVEKHWVSGEIPAFSVLKFVFSKSIRKFIFASLVKLSPGFFGGQIHLIAKKKV